MNLFILLKSVMKCFTGRPWRDIDGHYWVPIAWSVHGRTICYNHDKIEGIRTKLGRKRVELTSSKSWILPQQCPMDTWNVSGIVYTPIQRAFRIWPPTPMQHLYQLLFIKIHLVCNILYMLYASNKDSDVANWYGGMGEECPLDSQKNCENREKRGEIREKRGESGKIWKKRKNRGEKAKSGRVFSLCPSWQIGLATLLNKNPRFREISVYIDWRDWVYVTSPFHHEPDKNSHGGHNSQTKPNTFLSHSQTSSYRSMKAI